jgi:hypothetical protein
VITCGSCRRSHATVAEVKACYAGAPAEVTRASGLKPVPDGYYTVVFNEATDDRITLRYRTQDTDADFAPGRQVVAYLTGPDNTIDYRGFAFADPKTGVWNVWKRFMNNEHLARALEVVHSDFEMAGMTYALESSNCWRCNRLLTVPASVHRGLGPVCAAKGW